jgi:hypothetical protein
MTVTLGGTAIPATGITSTAFTVTIPAHRGLRSVGGRDCEGSSALSANSGYVFTSLASYFALTPFRILDTRGHTCVQCGAGRLAANQTRTLQITGVTTLQGGADQFPATATAIAMNVTAVSSSTGGLLTIYPTGTALPRASNLNFSAGAATPNLVTVTLGQTTAASPNWDVNIYNPVGSLDVVADVEGTSPRLRAPIQPGSSTPCHRCGSVTQGRGKPPTPATREPVSGIDWARTRSSRSMFPGSRRASPVLRRVSRMTAPHRRQSSTSPRSPGRCQPTSASSLPSPTARARPHLRHRTSTSAVASRRRTEYS